MGCEPTRMLRDEHSLILQVIDVFEEALAEGRHGADMERIAGCVDFFRLYADACHHGKEEDLLFEELIERGFSRHEGPVAMMLQEHALGRLYVKRMAGAVAGMTQGDNRAWSDLLHAGRSYIDLLRRHIGKENNALFDMADELIDGPACERLCRSYDDACARRFEGRSLPELEAMARELVG